MKNYLLALLLLVPAALPAASFEGKVVFKTTVDRGKSEEISYLMKGGKLRIEVPGQKEMGGMIIDVAKKETIMIMAEPRMYLVMALPDVAAQAAAASADDAKLEKTGETVKLLGYVAEKYITTAQGKKTELWLAQGLGSFMSLPDSNPMGGARPEQAWERALAGKDLFPLRVVSHDQGGKENFRMEATAIDRTPLPDSLFAPPAGYQKLDMGGMIPGGMPGLRP